MGYKKCMVRLFVNWLLNALAIIVVANFLPGVHVQNFTTALIVALVLGIINIVLKPVLVILTLPINILTLGLFTLVINGFLILLTSFLVKGFVVDSFWWAFLFALILGFVNGFIHMLMPSDGE